MPHRPPAPRRPPIGFAHRGARADAPENTLEAFDLALRLGATGLESDVWRTSDGVAVLDHDGVVRRDERVVRISELERHELPGHIPTLADLYTEAGAAFDLSLDVKDPAAFGPTLDAARAAGHSASERLWLCHPDVTVLTSWRPPAPEVRLVDSTRLRWIPEGVERRAAALAGAGIDALNLHHTEWTGESADLVHRFGCHAFGWDAQLDSVLSDLLLMGLDAVYSDHVDRMVAALDGLRP